MKLSYLTTLILYLILKLNSCKSLEVIESQRSKKHEASYIDDDGKRCLGACTCYTNAYFIDCKDTEYEVVPYGIPANTRRMDLSSNKIPSVSSGDFQGLENMDTLDMSHNPLTSIQSQSFLDMTSLSTLYFGYNQLRVMRKEMFTGLSNLITIDFQYNGINTILPNAFSNLAKLESLKLDFNTMFSPIGNESFVGLKSLKSLNLAGNFLYQIPMDALQPVKDTLLSLNMSYHGRISTIGGSDSPEIDLPNLEILDLSRCRIQSIVGGSLFGLPNLKTLDLTSNALLIFFPRSFVGISGLQNLHLGQNPIQNFPYSAFEPISKSLKKLEMSYFSFIMLNNLPSNYDETYLANLTSLTFLNGNLATISGESFFKNLKLLKSLTISYCQMADFPTTALNHLINLEKMHFVSNKISSIDAGSIPYLPMLREIEFSHTELDTVDTNSFHELNLDILRLNHNKIFNITSDAFDKQKNLITMDISNNLLRSPNYKWFQGKPLKEVLLQDNPWNCDCKSDEFLAWTTSQEYENIESIDSLQCDQPRIYRGDAIENLEPGDLTCDFGDCPSTCVCTGSTTNAGRLTSSRSKIEILESMVQKEYSSLKINNRRSEFSAPLNRVDNILNSDEPLQVSSRAVSETTDCTHSDMTAFPFVPNATEYLNLAYNEISGLSQDNFENLRNLKTFIASDNSISSIENETFSNAELLEELYLTRNKLSGSIRPKWFSNLKNLIELRLDDNSISDISVGSLGDLKSLQILEMSKNYISALHATIFFDLTELVYLNLGGNIIRTIDENAFMNLTNLAYLYLNDNSLTTIPSSLLLQNTKLIYLDIGGNSFSVIPTQFLLSESLEILKIENGYNTDLENESFAALPNLKVLRLSNSWIANIGVSAFSLNSSLFTNEYNESKLLTLDLADNNIETIPIEAFVDLDNLQTLGLNDNTFSEIPTWDGSINTLLPSCETLYLSGTSISEIPENSFISQLTNLQGLVMNDCKLSEIPLQALKYNTKLGHLVLDRNPITEISSNFSQLSNLVQLQLTDTGNLETLSAQAFRGMAKLESLKLSGGKIQYIPSETFVGLVNLEVLDLSHNKMSYPESQWFSSINSNKIKSINLQDNPWVCDCGIVGYKEWMESNLHSLDDYFTSITCTEPQKFKSWKILEINTTDLTCDSSETTAAVTTLITETTTEIVDTSTAVEPPDCEGKCTFNQSSHVTDCSNNRLRSIPRSCIPTSSKILILSNNLLNVISHDFAGLSNLEEIYLDHNSISDIEDEAFVGLLRVTYLDISSNLFTQVPTKALAPMSENLQALSMDDQRISQINENAFPLANLKHLSMRNIPNVTPLTIGDFSFALTSSLMSLDLSSNNILTLSRNAFTGLENLQSLDISESRLQDFPEEALRRLPNLKTLIINNNSIQSLSEPVTPLLAKLEYFCMRNSLLSAIEDNSFLSDLSNLEELDIGHSFLSYVPTNSLKNKPSLTTLRLDYSLISEITQTDLNILSVNNITVVDFTGSKIVKIGDGSFTQLPNLSWLDLSDNDIEQIADTAFTDTNLQYLDLSNNNLTSASCSWFFPTESGQLKTIKLGGNPYDCSCGMVGYRAYMTTPEYEIIPNVEEPVCATPQELSGKTLSEITLEDLENYCESESESEPPQYCYDSSMAPTTAVVTTTTEKITTTSSAGSIKISVCFIVAILLNSLPPWSV